MMELTPAHLKIVNAILEIGNNGVADFEAVKKFVKMRGQFVIKYNELVEMGVLRLDIDYNAKTVKMVLVDTDKFTA